MWIGSTTAPTADPGADQVVTVGDMVNLDGSNSFDDTSATADMAFSWVFRSIPAGSSAMLNDASTQNPSFVADVPGAYSIELVVTDEAGLSSEPMSVSVSSLNVAPTADAGDDDSVILNSTAVLDGLGSSDPEDQSLTYSWTMIESPDGSQAALVDADTPSPSFAPDLEGEYTVELIVNDGFENSAPATVTISGITAGDFAKDNVRDAMGAIRALPKSAFDKRGHKRAMLRQLRSVVRKINQGRTYHAAFWLRYLIIPRVDGVALRGTPDPKGRWCWNRGDWVVDGAAQLEIYTILNEALDALCD